MASPGQSKPMQTAFLHRVVRLNDRADSQVFTFILPPHLTKGYLHECASKDFTYGYQKWRAVFTRDEKHLGVFLLLRTAAGNTTVTVDFSFTALNREHFTNNETYAEKRAVFDSISLKMGRPTFLGIYDLQKRGFLFPDQKGLIELEMKGICTEFTEEIGLPRDNREMTHLDRLETTYFAFADCDWNLAIYLKEEDELGALHPCPPNLMLFRHSHFDHWSRVKYRVHIRNGDVRYDSEVIDQMLDNKGYSQNHPLKTNIFSRLNLRQKLHVRLSMISMWPITTVDLVATNRNKKMTRCYDTDKQQWMIETDILGRLLKLRLYYSDVKNVPRNFTRFLCWNAYVIPYSRDKAIVKAVNGPFSNYYSQKDSEEGFEIEMDLPVEDICDQHAGYTEPETGFITAQIEWHHSHLLYHDFYHHYDDISRLHKHQMSREVATLQAENYSLEKQIFSYQMSISRKDAGMDSISHGSAEGNESKDSGISTGEQMAYHSVTGGRQRTLPAMPTANHIAPQTIKEKYGL